MDGCRPKTNSRAGSDAGRDRDLHHLYFQKRTTAMLHIIIVGLVAGIVARLLSPGPNNPGGFILTVVLGIVGGFLATFVGQAIGHYGPDQGAGYIMATIGALVVLFIWNRLVARGVIPDHSGK